jgi:hypothetical protein
VRPREAIPCGFARAPLGCRGVTHPAPPAAVPLTRVGKTWRFGAVVIFLGLLAAGTYSNTDDSFPFGPMAQYSTSPDLDAEINSAYVLADTTDGRRVRVPLNATGTGIGRAEVEGQLGRIIENPELLQAIANAYAKLHPDRPQYTRLYLMQDTTDLEGGKAAGPPVTRQLAQWEVR